MNIMGICISTAEACISATDDAVNSFLNGQSRYNNESKLAQEHLGKQNAKPGKENAHINNVLQSGLSPIYPSLPKAATKHHCRNVYDGDTLTLDDGTRVRFLGVDTPEMKENQAFSLEAKEYTKKYCHGKDVWLTYEESGGKSNEQNKDHYGRMLAFVWVPLHDINNKSNPSQWLCLNEGLIASGLAHAYSPTKAKRVHNHDKLLGLQKLARVHKSGQWKTFKDYNITVSPNGSAFHKCKNKKSSDSDCKHLARSNNLKVILASEAYDKGMHPCRNCLG